PSHRTKDGSRVNGKRHTKRRTDGTTEGPVYVPPKLANPGNVVQRLYTAEEVAALLAERGDVVDCVVGGGRMGSKLAEENEAPFPSHWPSPSSNRSARRGAWPSTRSAARAPRARSPSAWGGSSLAATCASRRLTCPGAGWRPNHRRPRCEAAGGVAVLRGRRDG